MEESRTKTGKRQRPGVNRPRPPERFFEEEMIMYLRKTKLKTLVLFATIIAIIALNLSATAYGQDMLGSDDDCRGHCITINGMFGCIVTQTSPFEGCRATTNYCYYQVCF